MIKQTLLCSAIFTLLVGCGSGRDTADNVTNSPGVVSISGNAVVGSSLMSSISDDDGIVAGTETYQWFKGDSIIDGANTSSYTLKADEVGKTITAVIRYTDNLGFRETDKSDPTSEVGAAFNLSAIYMHSLVDGAVCNIFNVDASGKASESSAGEGTTVKGIVDFGAFVQVHGTALIQCTGGTYTDEATGKELDAPNSRAIAVVDQDAVFTVSPLTEIATQRALASGDLNMAITKYNPEVATAFGLLADITQTTPTDLLTTAASDDDAGAYASVLALLSQLDATDTERSAGEVLTVLAEGLVDNKLSDSSLNDLNAAQEALQSSPIFSNINTDVVDKIAASIGFGTKEFPAEFKNLTASIDATTATLTGAITITDQNSGEDQVLTQTDTKTTFGTFSISPSGDWDYRLDTANATIAALTENSTETDTIALISTDGTTENLVITINGVPAKNATTLNQVAVIRDTSDSDTGELRYALYDTADQNKIKDGTADGLLQGQVSVQFTRRDDNVGNADAYISLFNFATNNDGAILDLKIKDDQFAVRSPEITVDKNLVAPILDAATLNTMQTAVITWEYLNGRDSPPQVKVVIDGIAISDPFTPTNQSIGGVTHVAFRLGNNSGVTETEGTFTIDNLKIYSDTAGTTEKYSDDFQSYKPGDSLDTDNTESKYNGSTSEAVVEATSEFLTGGDADNSVNKIAVITDTSDADTGELRRSLPDTLVQGKMTVKVKKEVGLEGFVNLSGNSTSRAKAMIDMNLKDSSGYKFTESGDIANNSATFPTFTNNQWIELAITWDASVAGAPLITVSIDGQPVTTSAFPSEGTLENIQNGVKEVQFRYGSDGGIDAAGAGFAIDDLKVYSDTAGTTLVIQDDFEKYTVGNSLDPNANTVAADEGVVLDAIVEPKTPYMENSFQVTVEEE